MLRRALITTLLVALSVGVALPLVAAAPPQSAVLLQEDTDASEDLVLQAPAANLGLGERFVHDTWELEVQDAFVADSPDRAGFIEIRASVAFRLLGGQSLPYDWGGFRGSLGYPSLQIVDGDGVVYPIDSLEPGHTLVPGSDLVSLDPYVPARWTVGFETNDPQSTDLAIQAVWAGRVVAEWDVFSIPQPLEGWTAPPTAEPIGTFDDFDWDEQLTAVLGSGVVYACGDPATQSTYSVFAVEVLVENSDVVSGYFPNVRYPETAAIAVWADGSSAQLSTNSGTIAAVVGEIATEDTVAINARNLEQVIVPGSSSVQTQLLFDLPRDGRFGSVTEIPQAIVLHPHVGPSIWWEPGDVTVEAAPVCESPNTMLEGGPTFEVTRP